MNEAPQGASHLPEDPSRAPDRLFELVYDELRALAARKLAQEQPGQTLQATALVHEAWMRLGGDRQPAWKNRAHFFAAATQAMRRILVDQARRRRAIKHGGQMERVNLNSLELPAAANDESVLALNAALEQLAMLDAQKAELVSLRFFGGLTLDEASQVLGISTATAKRHWTYARAWLYRQITQIT